MIRMFLILAVIVYAIVGIALLAIPDPFMDIFGLSLGGPAQLMARLVGAGELALAVTLLLMANDTVSTAGRAVLAGQALYNVIAVVLLILGILGGRLDSLAGVLVIVHAILAAGFAWSWIDGAGRR